MIEIPDFFVGSMQVIPDPANVPPELNGNPIISSRGFQPFDPSTLGTPFDFDQIRGGFTRLDAGAYVAKTIPACDTLMAVVMVTAQDTVLAEGFYFPALPDELGQPLADGQSILIACIDFAGSPTDPSIMQVTAWRYNTEDSLAALEAGLA